MHTEYCLKGKVALITGAAGALGAHFSRSLGLAGAALILAGRRYEPLEQLSQALRSEEIESLPVQMDVTDPDSVRAAFEQGQSAYGAINVVICNAGIAVNKKSLDVAADEWARVVDVNLKGSWLVCAEAGRRLVEARRPGSIITISSILGHRVAGAVLPYTASKAAVEQMTRALALEWARYGIRVNALAPGYIETDLNREFFQTRAGEALIQRIPQRRLGRPEDLDGALLLLASDASSYMTGSSIVVDGGHLQSSL
ncbi:MAG TPA: SDR family oxidoreductase [Burkholderiaceae bacterium]|nr:SDR family oxidoreductase [Burkholderiaceae bacterium]